ncbi:translesion DNA synthesis-associated protein ImuA [Pseudomonadales bacterium]|nr:translesion DNA synthesis-associated protein ImuA [Pseudomonadales bacterium]MDB9879550.1 translesion DNA synthesis-associated protein ImuA [Pseudomonadales bacterium]
MPIVSRPSESLPLLLKKTGLWRASHLDCEFNQGTSTGYDTLDQHLPGAGWPTAGITELLFDQAGIGELRLLAPALASLSQQQGRWQLWVSPPHLPYAPALAQAGIDLGAVLIVRPNTVNDSLWVMEQALGSQSCSAVLAWPQNIHAKQIRRLQVASKAGHCLGVLFRHSQAAHQSSPAELRLQLTGQRATPLKERSSIGVQVLKRRGGWSSEPFTLDFHDQLNQVTPDFSEMIVRNPPPLEPELAFIEQSRHLFADERQQQ